MALLLDSLFIDSSDFKEFSDISRTLLNDVTKMELYIREAQISDIRNFLGDELYLKMVVDWQEESQDFATARYNDVWFGKDYTDGGATKRSHGLKVAHVYYTLSRIIVNNSFNTTRYGNKDLQDGSSNSVALQVVRGKYNAARSQALIYQNECKRFLELNASDYPEWPDRLRKAVKTGIQMMKI
jgi:hypothetical protein